MLLSDFLFSNLFLIVEKNAVACYIIEIYERNQIWTKNFSLFRIFPVAVSVL